MHKDYMDRHEVAKFLGLSIYWLEGQRNNPELPYVRAGRKVYYRRADVEQFKQRREHAMSHLKTLEELQAASAARQTGEPSRAELDKLFGGVETKKAFKAPPPVETDLGSDTKMEIVTRLGSARKITRLHDVTQFSEVEQSGVYEVPGLGIILHSRSRGAQDKG